MTGHHRAPLASVLTAPQASIRAAMEAIDRSGARGVIVVDDDRELLGIVMDSDIRRAILRNMSLDLAVRTVMKAAVFTVPALVPVAEQHRLLMHSGKLLAPIVDEQRRVVSYLTIEDAIASAGGGVDAGRPGGVFPPARVLVIGGAGYIGSVLVEMLLSAGYRVRVLDLLLYGKASLPHLEAVAPPGAWEFMRGDCRDADTVARALQDVDAVVHLGEIVGDPACQIDEAFTIETNYAATHMIAETCLRQGIGRFVFASSCSVYGQNPDEVSEDSALNPVSLYARCKVQSERAILASMSGAFAPAILRLATVHGRSYRQRLDLVVNLLSVKAAAEGRIQIMGGTQWRPFVSVRDTCRAFVMALQADRDTVRGRTFNVGDSRENYQLVDIGRLIQAAVPTAVVEVLAEQEDPRSYRVNFTRIHRELGFSAAHLVPETIQQLVAAYRDDPGLRDYKAPRFHNLLALQ